MNTRRVLRNKSTTPKNTSEEETSAVKCKSSNDAKGKSKHVDDSSPASSIEEESDSDISVNNIINKSSNCDERDESTCQSESQQKVKRKFDFEDNGSSSDSSVGDYLKNADEIDLNSTFFKCDKSRKTPDFDSIEKQIFTGVQQLSDSDISDEEQETSNALDINSVPSIQVTNSEDKKINFNQLQEYSKKLEAAKACVQKYEKRKSETESKVDISHLLAVCETKTNDSQESMESADIEDDSDDEMDWEEIEEGEDKKPDAVNIPKEGVQITLEMPTVVRKKKGVDFVAVIKRRINRVKKENQVYVHKVHLLCWIAHGNFLNAVLNNENLLGMSLSLIPSENCYPPKHADLNYLEQIVRWYGKMMKLQDKSNDDKRVPLQESLQTQINKKLALSKRDLVLIFVIILRSLGLQCRLVVSLQCLPLRPPNSELCSLSTKENQDGNKASASKDTSKTVSKKATQKASSRKLTQSVGKVNKNESFTQSSNKAKSKKSNIVKKKLETCETKAPNLNKLKLEKTINSKKVNKIKEISLNKLETKAAADKKCTSVSKSELKGTSEGNNNKSTPRATTSKTKQKPVKLSQLDGADDSPSTSNRKGIKKPNLSKLRRTERTDINSDACISKRHPRKVKLKDKKSNEVNEDVSDDDFKPSSRSSSLEKRRETEKKAPASRPKAKLDVRNDIVNLIKGQMAEQRRSNKQKTVRKKSRNESDYDSDYAPEPEIKKRKSGEKPGSDDDFKTKVNTNVKRRVKPRSELEKGTFSADDSESNQSEKNKKIGADFWVEVFLESEEKWISADVIKGQVHCIKQLHNRASQPVSYILAWNNNRSLKDVTARYSPHWNTVTRKLRVDPAWWAETLRPFLGVKTARDREEDEDLARQQLDQPLPTTISEYKNHPLYVLKRHLLKFEAIYPPDAVTLGFVRGEAVYARECVHTLHSREIWVKHAKVVKLGEQPYKIVKARPKYDKLSGTVITDKPLEIFGKWQVEDYVPPTAENGVVPRNAFGNVELFKQCMLPKKTVHLQLPGLNRVARKLQIDCAPAVVGFDFHAGGSHPMFDGYVVCEEFRETLIAAWEQDQAETARKEMEKIEKRVYGNWRKLIKGLLIRERLKARYNFGTASSSAGRGKSKSKTPKGDAKKRRICSDKESESD